MPIVTLNKVKTFLNITDTTKDALITALIPEIEADFLLIRNKPFIVITGNLTTGAEFITNVERFDPNNTLYYQRYERLLSDDQIDHLFDQICEGMTVSDIAGTKVYGKIINIDKFNQQITLDADASATATGEKLYIYPEGCQLAAAEMLKYMMNKKYAQSESFGDYSFSSEEMVSGYPKSITNKIRRFISFT